jgi:hypothetical protein
VEGPAEKLDPRDVVAASSGRLAHGIVSFCLLPVRNHLAAQLAVRRQDAEVPGDVTPRCRHQRSQASYQGGRLEDDRAGAVAPRALEGQLDPAIREPLESVVGERRAKHMAAESLPPLVVVGRDAGGGLEIEAGGLGAELALGL